MKALLMAVLFLAAGLSGQPQGACVDKTFSATGRILLMNVPVAALVSVGATYYTTGGPSGVSMTIEAGNQLPAVQTPTTKISGVTDTTAADMGTASGAYKYWWANLGTLSGGSSPTVVLTACFSTEDVGSSSYISAFTLQASQVSAITDTTTTRTVTTGLGNYQACDVLLNITGGGAVTGTLQIYVQDSPDGGTTWDDVISSNTFTFGAAAVTQRFMLQGRIATTITQGSAVSVEALTAGTVRSGPWGDRLRVREKVSGTGGTPTGATYKITAVCKK